MQAAVLGLLGLDKYTNGTQKFETLGGPSLHISRQLSELGDSVTAITSSGYGDKFNLPHVQLCELNISPVTVEFNVIDGVALPKVGLPENYTAIALDMLPDVLFDSDCLLVSTIMQEVSPELLAQIREGFLGTIALDIQGYQRQLQTSGEVVSVPASAQLLQMVDILKMNQHEFDVQFENLDQGVQAAKDLELTILISCGDKGAKVITQQGEVYEVPAQKFETENTVGCGDRLLASFVHYYLLGEDPKSATADAQAQIYKFLSTNNG